MSHWTAERVAERFEECVATLRKLPAVYRGGYRSVWPAMIRSPMELSRQCPGPLRLNALPEEITQMEETCRWVQWISERERQLVWLRAYGVPWRAIEHETGIPRSTGHRMWIGALTEVARRLEAMRVAA